LWSFARKILEDSAGNQFVADSPPGSPGRFNTKLGQGSGRLYVPTAVDTLRPVRDYFSDQCGIPISAGSLYNFNKEAFGLLETFETLVRGQLIAQELLHADETGINVKWQTVMAALGFQ